MNVLIKGVDMPKYCAECPCRSNTEWGVDYCQAIKGEPDIEDPYSSKLYKCPLELVPDKGWDEYKALSQTTHNLLLKSLKRVVQMLEDEYFIKCVLDEVARRCGNEEF